LFLVVSVRHPQIPMGALGVTIPSVLVYAAACLVGVCLNLAPRQVLRGPGASDLPLDMRHLGRRVVEFASALLYSGSYVLCDVRVPAERLRVRIALI
jgi:hypothetical protein